jgi:hypothetical protein
MLPGLRRSLAADGFCLDRDPRPGVDPLAFAALTGGRFLPRTSRERGCELIDPNWPGGSGYPPVRRDLKDIAETGLSDSRPQFRVSAVDLVTGYPGR